jgi:hypothetical protein
VRTGAEGHAGVEDQNNGLRIRRVVPGGNDPQAPRDANRFELRLGQLHPVLLGDFFLREKVRQRREAGPRSADARPGLRIGVRLEQGDDRERSQPGRLIEPGSPNCGCSSAVPASASSMLAASAPASSSASAKRLGVLAVGLDAEG